MAFSYFWSAFSILSPFCAFCGWGIWQSCFPKIWERQEEGPETRADVSTFLYKDPHCRHGKHVKARTREERWKELQKQHAGAEFPGGTARAHTEGCKNICKELKKKSSKGTFYPFVRPVTCSLHCISFVFFVKWLKDENKGLVKSRQKASGGTVSVHLLDQSSHSDGVFSCQNEHLHGYGGLFLSPIKLLPGITGWAFSFLFQFLNFFHWKKANKTRHWFIQKPSCAVKKRTFRWSRNPSFSHEVPVWLWEFFWAFLRRTIFVMLAEASV